MKISMKKMRVLFCLFWILNSSCDRETNKLFDYYYQHPTLHKEMRNEGLQLLQKFPCGVLLKKISSANQIIFIYPPGKTDIFKYAYFDSTFRVIDNEDKSGDENRISTRFLNNFANSIYHAIKIDSGGIFFADKNLHSLSEYEVGTYYSFDSSRTNQENVMERLAPDFYLYKDIIP